MQRVASFSILLMLTFSLPILSQEQTIEKPAMLQSARSGLRVEAVNIYPDSTVVNILARRIQSQDFWLCADSSLVLEDPESKTQFPLLSARGVPWCPNAKRLTEVGQEFRFVLVFPFLPNNPDIVNIFEEGAHKRIVLNGIILNEKLSNDMKSYERGVRLFVANRLSEAVLTFEGVIEEIPEKPTHAYGNSYLNLVRISWQLGDSTKADRWINQIEKSSLSNREFYLQTIRRERRMGAF